MRQLSATDNDSSCFYERFSQTLGDFAVEWKFRTEGKAALLVFGQDNIYYWITLVPSNSSVGLAQIPDFKGGIWQSLGDSFPSTVYGDPTVANTVRATRTGPVISIAVNGEEIRVISDALFGGKPVPIKVGFGAAIQKGASAKVYLEQLDVLTPMK